MGAAGPIETDVRVPPPLTLTPGHLCLFLSTGATYMPGHPPASGVREHLGEDIPLQAQSVLCTCFLGFSLPPVC